VDQKNPVDKTNSAPKVAPKDNKRKATEDKKASFKRARVGRKPLCFFDYEVAVLEEVPEEAWPKAQGGKHSYTLRSINQAVIEVQLRNKKFYAKKVAGNIPVEDGKANYSWSKYGSAAEAWEAVKKATFWEEAAM
jgi:hypothetical protein